IAHAPAVIACTCIYWRNAWKYQARTYRHFGWDNGTVLANLLAVATALGLPAKVVCGFQDAEVNRLLDVDPQRKVAFSPVALGHVWALPPQPPSEISPLGLETVPPSQREVDYPLMREMHAASSLHTADEVRRWRPRPDQFAAALHSARPSHARRARGFSRSAGNSVERPLFNRPCSGRSGTRSLCLPSRSRHA